MLTRTILLQMAGNKGMESFARHNRLAAGVAKRFIAGETLAELTPSVRALNSMGMTATLDFLGESVTSQKEVDTVVDTYEKLIRQIRTENLNANMSVKLTSLGLDISPKIAEHNLQRILDAAGDLFVRIDMEGSAFTQVTLDIFYSLWGAAYRNTGVVIQSYLHRSAADIEELIRLGARVRLCKGAYSEPPTVAFTEKADVDAGYVALMKRLLKEGNYPGIATHDSKMIEETIAYANQENIGPDKFEFQMLYGVRSSLQEELVKQGYRMRIYTPFGDHWYPYTMRRLAERPANLWFALNSIVRN